MRERREFARNDRKNMMIDGAAPDLYFHCSGDEKYNAIFAPLSCFSRGSFRRNSH